ncbi:MAG TPA: hypothetical protein VLE73_06030 [Candidatus Saccharimonadales bacterium]|nr:hypothetical protein [Candidatus Saccharimonadales bacterium]
MLLLREPTTVNGVDDETRYYQIKEGQVNLLVIDSPVTDNDLLELGKDASPEANVIPNTAGQTRTIICVPFQLLQQAGL